MSKLEDCLFFQIQVIKLPLPVREFKFHPIRKWRSDFVWPDQKLIVEVEGGVYTQGRHTRGNGFIADCEKYNEATLLGYRLLRVTNQHIKSGDAIQWIESALVHKFVDNSLN